MMKRLQKRPKIAVRSMKRGSYTTALSIILFVDSTTSSIVTTQIIETFIKAPKGCIFSYPNVRRYVEGFLAIRTACNEIM